MDCNMPGFPPLHCLPEFAETHLHWVSNAIQPSHLLPPPSLPAFSLSQHQGLFHWIGCSNQVAKVLELQLQQQSFQWILYSGLISFRIYWFDLLAVQGTLKRPLKHHSSKASILQSSTFFIVQFWHPHMTTGKTIALTRRTFAGKVMSLLFNMLSQFVAAFIPRSKSFNFIAAVTICSDFGVQENKVSHCFHCFPIYLRWSGRTRWHYLHFWMFSVKPAFSLSSFTFIKRLFSFSSLRVVSSAYLRLLIFLPAILIPVCASSSPVFLMMYSAHKLNKHGDSIQLWPHSSVY